MALSSVDFDRVKKIVGLPARKSQNRETTADREKVKSDLIFGWSLMIFPFNCRTRVFIEFIKIYVFKICKTRWWEKQRDQKEVN